MKEIKEKSTGINLVLPEHAEESDGHQLEDHSKRYRILEKQTA